MRLFPLRVALLVSLLATVPCCRAANALHYIFRANGSVQIGSSNYSGDFRFDLLGDTTNYLVGNYDPGDHPYTSIGRMTGTLSFGNTTVGLTEPLSIDLQKGSIAFRSPTVFSVLGIDSSAFVSYDLRSIGDPFPAETGYYYVQAPFATSAGPASISVVGLVVTFQSMMMPTPFSASKLINISTKSFVGNGGDVQIAGFIIGGSTSKKVFIRASGPGLSQFGVMGVLADPKLELHDLTKIIGTNDNWGDNSAEKIVIEAARKQIGAFAWIE